MDCKRANPENSTPWTNNILLDKKMTMFYTHVRLWLSILSCNEDVPRFIIM